jgi:hypothetical protein
MDLLKFNSLLIIVIKSINSPSSSCNKLFRSSSLELIKNLNVSIEFDKISINFILNFILSFSKRGPL